MSLYIDGQEILRLRFDNDLITHLNFDGTLIARPPTITTQPSSGTIKDSESYTLSVVADGLGSTMSYQWYKSDGTAIDGAIASSYTFTPSTTGSFSFYCMVDGFGEATKTETATVTVETSGTVHTLTIGKLEKALWTQFGFFALDVDQTEQVGELLPRLAHTGDDCAALGVTVDYTGASYGAITFNGELKPGSVTVTIQDYGSISGTLIVDDELVGVDDYGVSFSESETISLLAFLSSNEGASKEIEIKYTP